MNGERCDTVVFLGPTLAVTDARKIYPDACYLPPARCGDILRALRLKPCRIALIDGLFERTASVWHKELMLALARGVEIFGASSMGALRAAEMHPYGMIGHGRIFEAFRDGELNDDDEVTVLHSNAYVGYAGGSEAMVNIRATLNAATAAAVLDAEMASALLGAAKRTFYHERNLTSLADAIPAGDPVRERFLAFLQGGGAVDQKKLDAVSLLTLLASKRPAAVPKAPDEVRTLWLRSLEREINSRALPWPDAPLCAEESVTCDARFLDDIYGQHVRIAKWLALLHGSGEASSVEGATAPLNPATLVDPVWGLPPNAVMDGWAADNGLSASDFDALCRRLAAVRHAYTSTPLSEEDGERWLLGLLRLEGRYLELDPGPCPERDGLALSRLAEWDPDRHAVYGRAAGLWQWADRKLLATSRADSELTLSRSENRFRLSRNLGEPDAAIQWCLDNNLSREDFQWLGAAAWRLDVMDELCVFELMEMTPPAAYRPWLADALRLTGWYGRLRSGRVGAPRRGKGDVVARFFAWHRRPIPDNLEAYALAHDFSGEYEFTRQLKAFLR